MHSSKHRTGSAHYDLRQSFPSWYQAGGGVAGTYLSYTKDGETHARLKKKMIMSFLKVDLSTIRYSVWDKVYNTAELDLQEEIK